MQPTDSLLAPDRRRSRTHFAEWITSELGVSFSTGIVLGDLYRLLPPEGAKLLLVLFLSFLTGLEREEHKSGTEPFSFSGVRTFPLIGLVGYALSFLAGGQILPVVLGFAVVASFLMLSYQHKVKTSALTGFTSEMSALVTYFVAALVYREQYWIAATLTVASMLLLELKITLEGLTKRIAPEEILSFTKFLLLTAVILPVVPNQEFGPFRINPAGLARGGRREHGVLWQLCNSKSDQATEWRLGLYSKAVCRGVTAIAFGVLAITIPFMAQGKLVKLFGV